MGLKEVLARARRSLSAGRRAEGGHTPKPGDGAPRLTEVPEVSADDIREAEASLERSPENWEGQVYLAYLYYAGQRYPEAIGLFERLVAAGYKPANQLYHLGNCFFRIGDLGAARDAWRRCLREDPPESMVLKVRARLLWVEGPASDTQVR